MKHTRAISRPPHLAEIGRITLAEQVILVVLAVFFNTWDNFSQVISNLQKYYAKTP